MKYLIFASLVFGSFFLPAQEAAAPFKRCNLIEVQADLSVRDLVSALQESGFLISNADSDLELVSSGQFKIWKSSGHVGQIEIWKKDGSVWITGSASVAMFGSASTWKMEKRSVGNVKGKLFFIVDEFATSLAADFAAPVTYHLN